MEVFQAIAKEYGLFVCLVAYILWFFDKLLKENRKEGSERETRILTENKQRESRYIAVIDKLSDSFIQLTTEVESIKTMMQQQRDQQDKETRRAAR